MRLLRPANVKGETMLEKLIKKILKHPDGEDAMMRAIRDLKVNGGRVVTPNTVRIDGKVVNLRKVETIEYEPEI